MDNNSSNRPLILICNDDSYTAGGIKALTAVAREVADVLVVAPQLPQSGMSSAITVGRPLRVSLISQEPGCTVYAVSGTPADCAKMAFNQLLTDRQPALMLSGINHGYNAGNSAIYSGTMGAVFEGLYHNVPSVGFSYDNYSLEADFTECLPWVRMIIGRALEQGLPSGVCLNVNIPCSAPGDAIKGLKITTAAAGRWVREYERRTDPFGRDYYWMTGTFERDDPNDDQSDFYWLERGWVSVTPCRADQTCREAMPAIATLLQSGE